MSREWHDFKWGMIYGVGVALTIFIAFVICGIMGVFG